MEQKMVFIESNIVKSTPVANAIGKILKTIVTKDLGKYEENNFYDKPEFVPLQHDTFQTIEIKFMSRDLCLVMNYFVKIRIIPLLIVIYL